MYDLSRNVRLNPDVPAPISNFSLASQRLQTLIVRSDDRPATRASLSAFGRSAAIAQDLRHEFDLSNPVVNGTYFNPRNSSGAMRGINGYAFYGNRFPRGIAYSPVPADSQLINPIGTRDVSDLEGVADKPITDKNPTTNFLAGYDGILILGVALFALFAIGRG